MPEDELEIQEFFDERGRAIDGFQIVNPEAEEARRSTGNVFCQCEGCPGCKSDDSFYPCPHCGALVCEGCRRDTLVSQILAIGADGYKLPCPEHTRYFFETWCRTCYLGHHTKTTVRRLNETGKMISKTEPNPYPVEIVGMQEPLPPEKLAEFDRRLWLYNLPLVGGR